MKVSKNSELFKTFDDTKLFQQSFSPEKDIKGVIIISHGLNEHSGCYLKMAKLLSQNNYSVYLYDLRGHGKSDGPLVLIESFEDLLDDLKVLLSLAANRRPKRPVFLFGQGIGGMISSFYAIRNKPEIRGMILSAPAVSLDIFPPFLQKTSWLIGRLFPSLPLVKINSDFLSTNSLVVQDYENDPLVYHGKISARTCLELVKASKKVKESCNEIKIPVLIVHGKEDQLFNFEGSKEMHEKLGSTDKTLKLYNGLSHLLLSEPEGKKVIADIVQWADSHVRT